MTIRRGISEELYDSWKETCVLTLSTIGITRADFAKLLGVTRQTVTNMLTNKQNHLTPCQYHATMYVLKYIIENFTELDSIERISLEEEYTSTELIWLRKGLF